MHFILFYNVYSATFMLGELIYTRYFFIYWRFLEIFYFKPLKALCH